MKQLATSILALAFAFVLAFTARADSWTDPDTGIWWIYTVKDGKATIGPTNVFAYGCVLASRSYQPLLIRSTLGGCPVVSIGSYSVRCTWATSVTIPPSVTNIDSYAFYACDDMKSAMISEGVTSIGIHAFSSCRTLDSIVVDAANPCFASVDGVIYDKTLTRVEMCPEGKTAVTLPPSVTSIREWAFDDCDRLESVTIPEGATSIGEHAFCDCTNLASVTIPSSVTNIGRGAFNDCRRLTSVTIPPDVTSIGMQTFWACRGLTNVTMSVGMASIGYGAFSRCSGLTSVTLPSSVTNLDLFAFQLCTELKSVTIPSSVQDIGWYAFECCSNLTNVTIPSRVKDIGVGTFYACTALTDMTIPSSVTNIFRYAFQYCSGLKSVTIPSSVKNIDDKAFYGCSGLTTVYVDEGDTERVKGLLQNSNSSLNVEALTFIGVEPLPDLGDNPSQEDIASALGVAADARLAECITNAADYAAFRAWANEVKVADGSAAAGLRAVKNAPHAWLAFALASATLIETLPSAKEIVIESFTPSSKSGLFDITVSIKGIAVGSAARTENLKQVIVVEGATSLDANGFSASNVDLTFGTPVDGKVKFTAGPKAAKADGGTFFMRVKLTP